MNLPLHSGDQTIARRSNTRKIESKERGNLGIDRKVYGDGILGF